MPPAPPVQTVINSTDMDKPDDLISASEAASIVGRSVRTLKRWSDGGALVAFRFPHLKASACYYSRREVEALIRPVAFHDPPPSNVRQR